MDPGMYFENNDPYFREAEDKVIDDELLSLSQATKLIYQSVSGEKEDEMFYQILIDQAPTSHEKEVIRDIQNDERKHNQILRQIYNDITGKMINNHNMVMTYDFQIKDYGTHLQQALFGELAAVKKYRKIMATLTGNNYTLLMSILSDELRHASMYNYLLNIQKDRHA